MQTIIVDKHWFDEWGKHSMRSLESSNSHALNDIKDEDIRMQYMKMFFNEEWEGQELENKAQHQWSKLSEEEQSKIIGSLRWHLKLIEQDQRIPIDEMFETIHQTVKQPLEKISLELRWSLRQWLIKNINEKSASTFEMKKWNHVMINDWLLKFKKDAQELSEKYPEHQDWIKKGQIKRSLECFKKQNYCMMPSMDYDERKNLHKKGLKDWKNQHDKWAQDGWMAWKKEWEDQQKTWENELIKNQDMIEKAQTPSKKTKAIEKQRNLEVAWMYFLQEIQNPYETIKIIQSHNEDHKIKDNGWTTWIKKELKQNKTSWEQYIHWLDDDFFEVTRYDSWNDEKKKELEEWIQDPLDWRGDHEMKNNWIQWFKKQWMLDYEGEKVAAAWMEAQCNAQGNTLKGEMMKELINEAFAYINNDDTFCDWNNEDYIQRIKETMERKDWKEMTEKEDMELFKWVMDKQLKTPTLLTKKHQNLMEEVVNLLKQENTSKAKVIKKL